MKSSVKQLISLGLLGLMLVKVWVIPLLYLDFEIRRDYIVANLCVNRSRPVLNCNGKCYLAKKLASLKEQEKRQAEQSYMSQLLDHVMDLRKPLHVLPPGISYSTILSVTSFKFCSPLLGRTAISDIFRPPLG